MVELSNIVVGYSVPLFKVESLTLEKGNLVALIGPNGSGKTTFLNTLSGVQRPLQGIIKIDGNVLTDIGIKQKVRLVSYVSSSFQGVNHLSVFDLIAMGRAPYTNVLHKLTAKDEEFVNEVIELLGLSELRNKSTTTISDGERQLAMIGKAIVQETSLMILDEPTAFLDYANRIKIIKLLKKLAIKYQKLIVLSTHDLDIALAESSLVIALSKIEQQVKLYAKGVDKQTIIHDVFGI
jgi:iron complex transport system ATP-binding protein